MFFVLDFRNIPFGIPLIDSGMNTRKRPVFVSNFSPVLILAAKEYDVLLLSTLLPWYQSNTWLRFI